MKKRNQLFILRCVFYVLLIGLPLLLRAAGLTWPCFYYAVSGILCPTCGCTRAFTCLMQGDFPTAVDYNAFLILFLLPVLAGMLLQDLYVGIARLLHKQDRISLVEFLLMPQTYSEEKGGVKRNFILYFCCPAGPWQDYRSLLMFFICAEAGQIGY
jgi:hypothetical protein